MTAELQPSSPPTVLELPADATAMLMTAVSCYKETGLAPVGHDYVWLQ